MTHADWLAATPFSVWNAGSLNLPVTVAAQLAGVDLTATGTPPAELPDLAADTAQAATDLRRVHDQLDSLTDPIHPQTTGDDEALALDSPSAQVALGLSALEDAGKQLAAMSSRESDNTRDFVMLDPTLLAGASYLMSFGAAACFLNPDLGTQYQETAAILFAMLACSPRQPRELRHLYADRAAKSFLGRAEYGMGHAIGVPSEDTAFSYLRCGVASALNARLASAPREIIDAWTLAGDAFIEAAKILLDTQKPAEAGRLFWLGAQCYKQTNNVRIDNDKNYNLRWRGRMQLDFSRALDQAIAACKQAGVTHQLDPRTVQSHLFAASKFLTHARETAQLRSEDHELQEYVELPETSIKTTLSHDNVVITFASRRDAPPQKPVHVAFQHAGIKHEMMLNGETPWLQIPLPNNPGVSPPVLILSSLDGRFSRRILLTTPYLLSLVDPSNP